MHFEMALHERIEGIDSTIDTQESAEKCFCCLYNIDNFEREECFNRL